MKRLWIAFSFCAFSLQAMSQQKIAIIPQPQEMQAEVQKHYTFPSSGASLFSTAATEKSAAFLADYLKKYYQIPLKKAAKGKGNITLAIVPDSHLSPGAYFLKTSEKGIAITGADAEGIFYGVQSLIQLLPTAPSGKSLALPYVKIKDAPRFSYRGLMLDCGRHFMPLDFIKKYIDFIALHKMNTFHWHLTDDQGWRIEIKKYPLLTERGAWRNGTIIGRYPGKGNDSIQTGGFYTQAQIKEIVRYAADRYITVIPEIEMPGHSSAAIAAYPQLSCFPDSSTKIDAKTPWSGPREGKQVQQTWGVFEDVYAPTDYTFNFLEDVLTEVMALFPSRFIHIGGDECPKVAWKESAFCQNLIKEKGLKDEEGLQSYFIHRIEKFLNSKGRQIIGWDEILEGGIAPNATIMSWRGEEGGIAAAQQKHRVIMTPGQYLYLDHSQKKQEDSVTIGGYLPIQTVYSYNPVPKELKAEEQQYIWGAQGNVWTEYMKTPAKVEYMVFPRLAALSEVLWTDPAKKDYPDFKNRLQTETERYKLWQVGYCSDYDNQPDK